MLILRYIYFGSEVGPGEPVEDGRLVVLRGPTAPLGAGVPEEVDRVVAQHLRDQQSLVLLVV